MAAGCGDRDLLADDRPHHELSGVDRAGHTYPGVGLHERSQRGVAGEIRVDAGGLRVEVKNSRDERRDMGYIVGFGGLDGHGNAPIGVLRGSPCPDGSAGARHLAGRWPTWCADGAGIGERRFELVPRWGKG